MGGGLTKQLYKAQEALEEECYSVSGTVYRDVWITLRNSGIDLMASDDAIMNNLLDTLENTFTDSIIERCNSQRFVIIL